MTSAGISRRGFIGGTAEAGVVLVIGAKASAQAGGDGPYGALAAQPDANGLLLPEGFRSRVIARAGESVAGTTYEWPAFPDGAATFPIDAGGARSLPIAAMQVSASRGDVAIVAGDSVVASMAMVASPSAVTLPRASFAV